MLTLDAIKEKLVSVGIDDVDDALIQSLMASKAVRTKETDKQSKEPLGDRQFFKFLFAPVVDYAWAFSKKSGQDNPFVTMTTELFDFTDFTFTQVADVAIDPFNGYYRFLTPLVEGEETLVDYTYTDTRLVMNEILYLEDIKNPVRREQRGNVTVDTRSMLEIASKYQQLNAMDGGNVVGFYTTRFSNGIVKGVQEGE